MSTITATPITTTTPAGARVSWRAGLTTVALAAVATTLLAAVLRAAGAGLTVDAEPIPLPAFAQMVLVGGVIGLVVARHVGRTTFVRTTVALTALSCVPSIALGTTLADQAGLVLTHVAAAAFIVPRLAPAARRR
jgi:hypothetical protein